MVSDIPAGDVETREPFFTVYGSKLDTDHTEPKHSYSAIRSIFNVFFPKMHFFLIFLLNSIGDLPGYVCLILRKKKPIGYEVY